MEDIEQRIAEKYFRNGEGFLQIYPDDQDGEMYDLLLREGREICALLPDDKVKLYFVDAVSWQAGADSELKTILVWKGILDLVFKLASLVTVHARPTPSPEHAALLPWRLDIKAWLRNGVFDWESQDYWWLRDPEYRITFSTFARAIFCFILLHEVGHFHNLHAVRREERCAQQGESVADRARLEKHAREIIADTYAFQFLMDELKEKLFPDELYYQRERHIVITEACFIFALISVSAVFWGFSVVIPMDESHQENGYPGHAFRLRAIQSAALEHGINGLQPEVAYRIVSMAIKQCFEIFEDASSGDFVAWSQSVQDAIHGAHYKEVCEEVSHWSNPFYANRS
ncbi:hypothetical protein [Pseudomonas aeruginosa]|uniref:hypothetical protein n=1 Tax=Pseudomonas aeruginosa TaxID=287 RepID=UPI001BC986FF|nr:hypothetical protein [Pseudomonas aeruginosa]